MKKTGSCIIVYPDDILVMAQSAEILKSNMQTLARELQALGFKLNHKNSVWEQVQAIKSLGFLVNSKIWGAKWVIMPLLCASLLYNINRSLIYK